MTNAGGAVTSYAVVMGSLPTGVSLNASTGALTGTPTSWVSESSFVIRATGPGGTSDATVAYTMPFSPISLSPALWLKADGVLWQDSARTVPATADADPVGAWDDASGNAVHFLQATSGARPALKLSIQNGLPVIRFDGSNDTLAATLSALSQPNHIFLVARLRSGAGYRFILDGTTSRNAIYQGDGGTWRYFAGSEKDGDAADTTVHQWTALFNGSSSHLRKDGSSTSTANPGAQGLADPKLATDGGSWSAVDICELIVVNDDCGSCEADCEAYLKARWGTP